MVPGSINETNQKSSMSLKSASSLGRGFFQCDQDNDDKLHVVVSFDVTTLRNSSFFNKDDHELKAEQKFVTPMTVESEAYMLPKADPIFAWRSDSVDLTATLWELSLSERARLIELGYRLRDVTVKESSKNNPADVVRFFIACSFDVDRAEKQFRKMLAWRLHHDVDNILKHYYPPDDLVNLYPGAVLEGLDKFGDPIFLGRIGVTDAAGLLRRYGHDEMIKHAIWLRELLCTGNWIQQFELTNGRQVKRAIVIEDLDQLQLFKIVSNPPLLSLYAEIMRLDQDNYPEAAKKIFILRAPALFRVVWNIVQHFFDADVRSKMVFTSRSNYIEVLSEYMDISVLPHCIVPGRGKGRALPGMPNNFEGGSLPPC